MKKKNFKRASKFDNLDNLRSPSNHIMGEQHNLVEHHNLESSGGDLAVAVEQRATMCDEVEFLERQPHRLAELELCDPLVELLERHGTAVIQIQPVVEVADTASRIRSSLLVKESSPLTSASRGPDETVDVRLSSKACRSCFTAAASAFSRATAVMNSSRRTCRTTISRTHHPSTYT